MNGEIALEGCTISPHQTHSQHLSRPDRALENVNGEYPQLWKAIVGGRHSFRSITKQYWLQLWPDKLKVSKTWSLNNINSIVKVRCMSKWLCRTYSWNWSLSHCLTHDPHLVSCNKSHFQFCVILIESGQLHTNRAKAVLPAEVTGLEEMIHTVCKKGTQQHI